MRRCIHLREHALHFPLKPPQRIRIDGESSESIMKKHSPACAVTHKSTSKFEMSYSDIIFFNVHFDVFSFWEILFNQPIMNVAYVNLVPVVTTVRSGAFENVLLSLLI
jgi:hypothetical protein